MSMAVELQQAMIAIEETTAVQADGSLVVRNPELKAGDRVKVIVLFEPQASKQSGASSRPRLDQNWAGGLSDLDEKISSVDLQHKASEWRGD